MKQSMYFISEKLIIALDHNSVHHFPCTAVRMAIVTGGAVITVPAYSLVLVIHGCLGVAGGCTGKHCVVCRVIMAISAGIPFAVMLARIDREIKPVMVPVGRSPG